MSVADQLIARRYDSAELQADTRNARAGVIAGLYAALNPAGSAAQSPWALPIPQPVMTTVSFALAEMVSDSLNDLMLYGIRLGASAAEPSRHVPGAIWSEPSQSSDTELFAKAATDARTIAEALRRHRGAESQERFMFDSVMPFIERYGDAALGLLDEAITSTTVTDSARYYYAYLLGHISDHQTLATRLQYLHKYAASMSEPLREGAEEAFGHLSAA